MIDYFRFDAILERNRFKNLFANRNLLTENSLAVVDSEFEEGESSMEQNNCCCVGAFTKETKDLICDKVYSIN